MYSKLSDGKMWVSYIRSNSIGPPTATILSMTSLRDSLLSIATCRSASINWIKFRLCTEVGHDFKNMTSPTSEWNLELMSLQSRRTLWNLILSILERLRPCSHMLYRSKARFNAIVMSSSVNWRTWMESIIVNEKEANKVNFWSWVCVMGHWRQPPRFHVVGPYHEIVSNYKTESNKHNKYPPHYSGHDYH